MHVSVGNFQKRYFIYLHTGKLPDHAALILHKDVLPFYEKHGFNIEAILTDNGREYCGRLTHHHYEIYLELNGIEHRKTRIATPKTNGFAERFNRTVKEEFFDIALRQNSTPASKNSRRIWTNGSSLTTTKDPIRDIATWEGDRLKQSKSSNNHFKMYAKKVNYTVNQKTEETIIFDLHLINGFNKKPQNHLILRFYEMVAGR